MARLYRIVKCIYHRACLSEAAVFLKMRQKHECVLWSWDIKSTYRLL